MTPNLLAWIALSTWPVVPLVVYAMPGARRRLARTTAWMVLLPIMFLPSALELKTPGFPALDKGRIAILSVILALQLFHRERLAPTSRGVWFGRAILGTLLLGAVFTVATNHDPLTYGPVHLPGLTSYDIVSIGAAHFLDLYLPFSIGRRVFRTEDDVRELFRVLTACGLIYLPLAALEVRLSPQLNNWTYGYFQHSWMQILRGGGYRPIVFMRHPLSVAFFAAMAFNGALALHRVRDGCQPGPRKRLAGVGLLLVLCKSMASILYSLFALALQPLLRRRLGSWILVAVAVLVVTFPVTRFTGVFPTGDVVAAAARVSKDRAWSLEFRFGNEDALLTRAMERPVFGWGTFGRNRVLDPDSGRDMSVTDGQWIIWLGKYGVVGVGALFGLVLLPVLRFVRRQRRMDPAARALASQLAVMVTLCTVDLLPNTWNDHLPLVLAGALYTLTGQLARRRSARPPVAVNAGPERPPEDAVRPALPWRDVARGAVRP